MNQIKRTGEVIGNVTGAVVTAPKKKAETAVARLISKFMKNYVMQKASGVVQEALQYAPKKWEAFLNSLEDEQNEYPPNVVWLSKRVLRRLAMLEAPVTTLYCASCILIHILHLTFLYGISNFLELKPAFLWTSPLTYLRIASHLFCHDSIPQLKSNVLCLIFLGPLAESMLGSLEVCQLIMVVAMGTGNSYMSLPLIRTGPQKGASGVVLCLGTIVTYLLFTEEPAKKNKATSKIPIGLILVIVSCILEELWNAVYGHDGMSHLLGGAAGSVVGIVLYQKRKEKEPRKDN
jgi:membrane associated rhomboid family serine protease